MTGEGDTGTKQHAFQTGDICPYLYLVNMFSITLLLASTVLLHTSCQAIPTTTRSSFLHLASTPPIENGCIFIILIDIINHQAPVHRWPLPV